MESIGTLAGCSLMIVAVVATAAFFARFSNFYRRELAITNLREVSLDGLRGMAALMVAVHHAAICRLWLETGKWGDAGAFLPDIFGPVGVILFFMLTGYLFWGKARAAGGWMNPWRLWRGRIYRIAPLYLFSVALVLLVATFDLGTSWLSVANWQFLLRLLGLGALHWHAIGRMYPGEYITNVVWTLWYEWRFYLLLPFIAWLAVDRRIFGIRVPIIAMLAAGFWLDLSAPAAVYFIFGMLSSELLQYRAVRERMKRPGGAAAAILTGMGLCWLFRDHFPATGPSDFLAIACFPVFLVVASGNTFWGFLAHPAIRCLGAVSFSLYLLHGIIFSFVVIVLRGVNLDHLSPFQFWLVFIPATVAITCLCISTYRWIEFPFLSIKHKSRATDGRKHDNQGHNDGGGQSAV
jgi:peptidoglycan/LPS O-acetylase OafA/YrhL